MIPVLSPHLIRKKKMFTGGLETSSTFTVHMIYAAYHIVAALTYIRAGITHDNNIIPLYIQMKQDGVG